MGNLTLVVCVLLALLAVLALEADAARRRNARRRDGPDPEYPDHDGHEGHDHHDHDDHSRRRRHRQSRHRRRHHRQHGGGGGGGKGHGHGDGHSHGEDCDDHPERCCTIDGRPVMPDYDQGYLDENCTSLRKCVWNQFDNATEVLEATVPECEAPRHCREHHDHHDCRCPRRRRWRDGHCRHTLRGHMYGDPLFCSYLEPADTFPACIMYFNGSPTEDEFLEIFSDTNRNKKLHINVEFKGIYTTVVKVAFIFTRGGEGEGLTIVFSTTGVSINESPEVPYADLGEEYPPMKVKLDIDANGADIEYRGLNTFRVIKGDGILHLDMIYSEDPPLGGMIGSLAPPKQLFDNVTDVSANIVGPDIGTVQLPIHEEGGVKFWMAETWDVMVPPEYFDTLRRPNVLATEPSGR